MRLDGYVQKLQFQRQKDTVRRLATAICDSFQKYFDESKKLAKAMSDGVVPNNCKVGVPFQPRERIQKSTACIALQKEIAAFTDNANSESVALFRRGQRLNVLSLRDEFVESIVRALPTLAKFALAECDVDKDGPYKNHDLVADYLVQHQHQEPLLRLTGLQDTSPNPLIPFLVLYKKIHGITREPEHNDKVSNRYFPKVAEREENADTAPETSTQLKTPDDGGQQNFDETNTIEIVGEVTDKAPPAATTTNLDGGGEILTQPEESAAQEHTPKETTTLGFVPASQLLPQVRQQNTATKTPRSYDKLNPYKTTPKPPPILLDGNRFDRNAFKAAIKVIRRHAAHNNLALVLWLESYVRAFRYGKSNPSTITPGLSTNTQNDASNQGANPYSKSNTPNPTPTQPDPTPQGSHSTTKNALTLCVNPNDLNSVGFNRKPADDDFEANDEEFTFYLLQMEFCERIAMCDSIRTTSTKKYTEIAPQNEYDFIYEATDDGSIDVSSHPTPKKLCFSPPAKHTANGRELPTVSMRDCSPNISNALAHLHLAIQKCINQPNTLFVLQNSFNEKSALMTSIAEEEELEESANGTLKSLATDSGADGKIAKDSEKKRKLTETRDRDRELQSYKDRLAASEAKLAKLKRLKTSSEATELKSNETGGPKQGAQTKKSTLTTPAPTKPAVSFDQANLHDGWGRRPQQSGQGRGRDGRGRGGRFSRRGRGGRTYSYHRTDSVGQDSTRNSSRQQQQQHKQKRPSKSTSEHQQE